MWTMFWRNTIDSPIPITIFSKSRKAEASFLCSRCENVCLLHLSPSSCLEKATGQVFPFPIIWKWRPQARHFGLAQQSELRNEQHVESLGRSFLLNVSLVLRQLQVALHVQSHHVKCVWNTSIERKPMMDSCHGIILAITELFGGSIIFLDLSKCSHNNIHGRSLFLQLFWCIGTSDLEVIL